MKTFKILLTSLFVAVTTFVVADTLPIRGPIPFETYDKDSNNKITLAEFNAIKDQRMSQYANSGKLMRNAGNSPTFADIDSNADGVITRAELKTHQQKRFSNRMNQMNSQGGQGMGMGQGRKW